jgi:F0F1-type ATP synthase epsilon subunit
LDGAYGYAGIITVLRHDVNILASRAYLRQPQDGCRRLDPSKKATKAQEQASRLIYL